VSEFVQLVGNLGDLAPLRLLFMPERMWSLNEFRFDEGIGAAEVLVFDAGKEAELMARDEAIALAHERDANLVTWWPSSFDDEETPSCIVAKVSLPLRWERLPGEDAPFAVDERLWFEASCGGRDFLVGNPHTFPGRMAAWCPHDGVGYNVSLGEIRTMSDESRYFVAGFLTGNEPEPPTGDEGESNEADFVAWQSATRRFRRTGRWYGRWGTCHTCGCVLLPDSAADFCHEHLLEVSG
jgi:hypothetical protein